MNFFFFFIICLKILVCHWRLQIISFNNNSIFPFFYLTEKLFGEFLSWDLQDALSHLPLKSGQSISIPVNISAKLDFSGQENLLHDLNDGKHPHDTHKQHHWGPFWFVPSNLPSISESASPESSHYNQDWLDCSLIDRKAVFTLACYGRSDPSEVIWNGVPSHFTFNRDISRLFPASPPLRPLCPLLFPLWIHIYFLFTSCLFCLFPGYITLTPSSCLTFCFTSQAHWKGESTIITAVSTNIYTYMKKVKTFVYQECMKLIENDSESDKLSIHQKIKSIKKCIYITKIETCFNTDNKKHFLSSESAYSNDFWRIMWHWRFAWWCWKSINNLIKSKKYK